MTVREKTVYYVSVHGSDADGDGSEKRPFRTIEKARDAIRSLPELPEGGVTVLLGGGEYNLEETFVLTPEDSGTAERPVIYAAAPGEEVSVVSKEFITGWRRLTDGERASALFGMSEEAKEHVYAAEIPAGRRFHFLYADGVSLPVSRMIGSDAWETDWPRASAGGEDFSPEGLHARFEPGILDGLDGWEDAELRLITAVWWNVNARLTHIDAARGKGLIESGLTVFYSNFSGMGGQFDLMNTPKYLRRGAWCVDSVRGRVYYWPADGRDPNDAVIFAPRLYELVRFQGEEPGGRTVDFITLSGLRFLYTDRVPETALDPAWLTRNGEHPDGMIYLQNVENCAVENCVLAYSGSQGIVLDHRAKNCRITGNEIARSSSGGVYVTGYGPGALDENKNNRIAKNRIHHVGLEYMHSCAVQFFGSGGNVVEYNYFHDLPYAAVSIIGMAPQHMRGGIGAIDTSDTYGRKQTMYNARWDEIDAASLLDHRDAYRYQHSGFNVIQYNICDDYMLTLRDGGALYAWCSGPGKVWQYNVGRRRFSDDWAVRAIHMDDLDGYNYIFGNRFYASGATDNSHTNGASGGRGDGGRTDLDVWDDTVSDNIWKENRISADRPPEGYAELREKIEQIGGPWSLRVE